MTALFNAKRRAFQGRDKNGLFDHVGGPDTPVGKELAKLASDPVFFGGIAGRQVMPAGVSAEMPTT